MIIRVAGSGRGQTRSWAGRAPDLGLQVVTVAWRPGPGRVGLNLKSPLTRAPGACLPVPGRSRRAIEALQ
jgi:hypothetical protein